MQHKASPEWWVLNFNEHSQTGESVTPPKLITTKGRAHVSRAVVTGVWLRQSHRAPRWMLSGIVTAFRQLRIFNKGRRIFILHWDSQIIWSVGLIWTVLGLFKIILVLSWEIAFRGGNELWKKRRIAGLKNRASQAQRDLTAKSSTPASSPPFFFGLSFLTCEIELGKSTSCGGCED